MPAIYFMIYQCWINIKGQGKKGYLIFGLCVESFAINSTAKISKNIDKS